MRCGFQKLEGCATPEGLWLESTVPGGSGRFRLNAAALCRGSSRAREGALIGPVAWEASAPTDVGGYRTLAATGTVEVADKLVRFTRPEVTEEYSVSVDGVRQDFVIAERPAGEGDLRVELALTGARAEAAAYGARLILEGSGRALAYSRLRATDANGQELRARLEVLPASRLAVRVADAKATYPVRIDPTFSDANWISLNPGMPGADGRVAAIAVDGDGNLYVGGFFTVIGSVVANGIAKWDGSTWSALGSGMGGASYPGSVMALAVSGTNLYAGGSFVTAGGVTVNGIACWNGNTWSALGSGIAGGGAYSTPGVYALAVSGTNLYAGGNFTSIGGTSANYIAKWNGSSWSRLGSGMSGGSGFPYVNALVVSGTNLYAGGQFTTAGTAGAMCVAKWNGSAWSDLNTGIINSGQASVFTLVVSGSLLYAGGNFRMSGTSAAKSIAAWNGSTWSALGSGMLKEFGLPGTVFALAVSGTNLYAGGIFTNAGGVTASAVAMWNGSAWSALSSGVSGGSDPFGVRVAALALSGTNLYVGGSFAAAGGVSADYVAAWNGSTWSALGTGLSDDVYAVALSGTNLYAGGRFTTAGGLSANYIAAWNGSAWSALGSGMNGRVNALLMSGTTLYAGGNFTAAGGVPANYIAAWDGSAWSGLGSGMNSNVNALALNGTTLYAGGNFTTAGATPANHVAAWAGSAWSALSTGTGGNVNALAVSGTTLYAGGDFTTAGEGSAEYIAAWDGSAWSAVGSGVSMQVSVLTVGGTNLYAGGWFSTAGTGVVARGIAAWNGSTWSALGSGVGGGPAYGGAGPLPYALAFSGNTLYAGGNFTRAGGLPATGIAAWDGSSWSAVGSGVASGLYGATVYALAADGAGHLFVGGEFSLAGTNVSPYIAEVDLNATAPVSGGQFGDLVFSPVTGLGCTFGNATVGQPYRIQAASSLAGSNWTDFTNFNYTGPIALTDPSATNGSIKFYRAVSP